MKARPKPTKTAAPDVASGQARVLVVEDDQDLQDLLRYNLIREGFSVQCVISGHEALERASDELPDLILLDLMLPGMDGLEVCRKLRANRSTVAMPIVMLTAKGEETDIVTGLELGADDYVSKPISVRDMTRGCFLHSGHETATALSSARRRIFKLTRHLVVQAPLLVCLSVRLDPPLAVYRASDRAVP